MTGVNYKNIINKLTGKTNLISNIELIRQELELLFNIEKYSLFFGNEIGVDLSKYLHLTNRTATFNLIKTEIEVALRKYGKVVPVSIDMRFDDSTNTIVIDLVVSPIANRNTTITVPITVST